jgi:hypothetical protein
MKPKTFVMIALAAVISGAAAVAAYTTYNQWDQGRVVGEKLVPALASGNVDVSSLVITREGNTLTLESNANGQWSIKERDSYPADPDKVRALLVKLAQAELIEAKTRMPDRHALLELEDPSSKDAKSRSLKLLDGSGKTIADLVIGKRRWDAFGSGKSGTYVRKAGDAQTWLANAEIDVRAEVRSWINPTLVETESDKIQTLTIHIPGEELLKIERDASDKSKTQFVGLPADAKLKDTTAADGVLRAAARIDVDDVRKLDAPPSGDVSTVSFKNEQGLEITYWLRKDGDDYWLSIAASGEGDAKEMAEKIRNQAKGWEYKITSTKAGSLLKRRADLIESS